MMSEEKEMEELQSVLDGLEEDLRLGRFEAADRWLSSANPDALYPATAQHHVLGKRASRAARRLSSSR
jgi:hypothetical protein